MSPMGRASSTGGPTKFCRSSRYGSDTLTNFLPRVWAKKGVLIPLLFRLTHNDLLSIGSGYVQQYLSAALRMRNGFLEGRERVGGRHGDANLAGRYHLRRLRRGWRQFRRKLPVAHKKAAHGERLEDYVQRAD